MKFDPIKQPNPFNKNILNDIIEHIQDVSEVTSIPSPCARMHLFNMAFYMANSKKYGGRDSHYYYTGMGLYLYDMIISHCLDVFELLFYWDELNLEQEGFSIENYVLPDKRQISNDKHLNFVTTRMLYTETYKKNLKLDSGTDVFQNGYYIRYQGAIIAATSPFTGFYTSASVNLGSGFTIKDKTGNRSVYFSTDKDSFRPIGKRDMRFQVFMYRLINEYAPKSYTDLKDYLTNYVRSADLESTFSYDSSVDLGLYGFGGGDQLQVIRKAVLLPDTGRKNVDSAVVVADRYADIYFRSLIDVKAGVSFCLKPEDYKDLADRELLGNRLPWLSTDDFLYDYLIELDDPVNRQRFYCPRVVDRNQNEMQVKVLCPLKETYFKYFDYAEENDKRLDKRLQVKQLSPGQYVVSLTLPTKSGPILLSKLYSRGSADKGTGRLIELGDDSVYLGIYPFVKDKSNPTNNGYFRIFTYHSKKIGSGLTFYKDTVTGLSELTNPREKRHLIKKKFEKDSQFFPVSTFYALERSYFDCENFTLEKPFDVDFDVLKLTVKVHGESYNAFILPRFIEKECKDSSGFLSVDVGTSNTNISVGTGSEGGASNEISDYHSSVNAESDVRVSSVVMLHEGKNNCFDLTVTNAGANIQRHLLSEFMPFIIGGDSQAYKFAIPTILNLHSDSIAQNCVSLVDANIAITYYHDGLRKLDGKQIDKPVSSFKWAKTGQEELYVYLFVDQLLLMARSYFLACSQDLSTVRVIWSTPLAMDEKLCKFYENLWKALYKKYFNNTNNLNLLKHINESRSPYYASNIDFGAEVAMTMDIGGGSSDILLYHNKQIRATTSYAYAANDLFTGNRNENIFVKVMPPATGTDVSMSKVEDNPSLPVYDLFNFRFAKRRTSVEKEFVTSNNEWMYLLALHCSALLFHAVQNCRSLLNQNDSDEECISGKGAGLKKTHKKQVEPLVVSRILLSGNGANLFSLLNEHAADTKLRDLAKAIIRYVYKLRIEPTFFIHFVDQTWRNTGVTIRTQAGMKAATSVGSICWQFQRDSLSSIEEGMVPLGDKSTIFTRSQLVDKNIIAKYDSGKPANQQRIIKKVTDNFNDFLTGFLGTATTNSAFGFSLGRFCKNPLDDHVVKEIIRETDLVNRSLQNYLLVHPIPAHSVFFVPVRALIAELSKYFANQYKR